MTTDNDKTKPKDKEFKVSYLGILGFLGGLITAMLAWDGTHSATVINDANAKIHEYITWERRITDAVMEMRYRYDTARFQLKAGIPVDKAAFNIERIKYEVNVINAYIGSDAIFGRDIKESGTLLLAMDESITDLFAENVPTDELWQKYLVRTNFLIGLKIQEQEDIIKRARTIVFKRIIDDIRSSLKQ